MIQPLFLATGVLLLLYAGLIFYYHRIWDRIPVPADPPDVPAAGLLKGLSVQIPFQAISGAGPDLTLAAVKVSIIIPARNEAGHIGRCLQCLFSQTFPKALTEILVINDFSTDETAAIVREQGDRCRLLNLSDFVTAPLNAYKKKAIETGIAHSSGELIVCTDADCTMGPDWIQTLFNIYQKENLHFIAAPVMIIPDGSALSIFQSLDFISLQGITGVAVYKNLYPMCNGANLAYTRHAYETVGGFRDIDHIASGDDMLLMKKIQGFFPGRSGYIKDPRAIVSTAPAENLRAFFSQRVRWASKISHYKHPATFLTLALVFLLNAGFLLLFITCFFSGHWRWLLVFIACKTVSEYFFVSKVASFFRQQSLMKYFALCQPFHIVYTVIAGSFGSFGSYDWKNRKVK